MSAPKCTIYDDGIVHRWNGSKWEHLGQIAYVLHEQSLTAGQVQNWWEEWFASDKQAGCVRVVQEETSSHRILLPETVVVVGSRPDRELAEIAIEGD